MTDQLDRLDRRLMEELQLNARLTVAELSERVALSPSACWRRVKLLDLMCFVLLMSQPLQP